MFFRYEGYEAVEVRRSFARMTAVERRRETEAMLQRGVPGSSVRNEELTGLQNATGPVTLRAELEGGQPAQRVVELLIVKPGAIVPSPVADRLPPAPRRWELLLPHPMRQEVEIRVAPPAGWEVEALPPGIRLETPELRAESRWSMGEGALIYRRTVDVPVARVPPGRYAEFRQAVLDLDSDAATSVVFVERSE